MVASIDWRELVFWFVLLMALFNDYYLYLTDWFSERLKAWKTMLRLWRQFWIDRKDDSVESLRTHTFPSAEASAEVFSGVTPGMSNTDGTAKSCIMINGFYTWFGCFIGHIYDVTNVEWWDSSEVDEEEDSVGRWQFICYGWLDGSGIGIVGNLHLPCLPSSIFIIIINN